jgi:maleylacetate reductase
MADINERTITEAVLGAQRGCTDPRLKAILDSLVMHLHDFAREVQLTESEWHAGIQFLTEVGRFTDHKRQEFILLSDALGLSSLVTAQNHRKPDGFTESTVLGPFFVDDAPWYDNGDDIANGAHGEPCFVTGTIKGGDGEAIANAHIAVWQSDQDGFYDVQRPELSRMQARGNLRSQSDGCFHFKSIVPAPYPIPSDGPVGKMLSALRRHPWRPAHLHFTITAPGYRPLTTHIFRAKGAYLDSDAVFGVRSSLIADCDRHEAGSELADGTSSSTPFYTLHYDFKLFPAGTGTIRSESEPPHSATTENRCASEAKESPHIERNIHAFIHDVPRSRVLFGVDTLNRLSEELGHLGARRALVVCTAQRRAEGEAIVSRLGHEAAGLFAGALMHVPVEVAREARGYASRIEADCVVAIGGGSTIGLGKAIALESELSVLAIPTTYAGSEMTPIYGITETGLKRTGVDARVLPKCVIYDPSLTLGLPVAISITSGINAIAHAAEGLYSRDADPITMLMAEEGIRALVDSLPVIYDDAGNIGARTQALYGAWLCGSVLGRVGMSLHHKLCHTLGGSFGMPHAATHSVLLPHALAYNYRQALPAMRRMSRAMHGEQPPAFLHRFAAANGAPTSLRELGFPEAAIERAADMALENPYWSPRPLERAAIDRLLRRAFEGLPPAID